MFTLEIRKEMPIGWPLQLHRRSLFACEIKKPSGVTDTAKDRKVKNNDSVFSGRILSTV